MVSIRRARPKWARLASGLYVPPYLAFAKKWNPCCSPGEVECSNCTGSGNNAPQQYQIVISGIVDQNCNQCDENFNGTFVVDWVTEVSGVCKWDYALNADPCSVGQNMKLMLRLTDAYLLSVLWNEGDTASFIMGWQQDYDDKINCLEISSLSLPLFFEDSNCNASSSTCVVTAL